MRTFSRLFAIAALSTTAFAQCDLTTLFAANNGGAAGGAVYFDLDVTAPIRISGLDVNTSVSGTPIGLTMWTIPGGTAGNMGSSTGWTQVAIDDGNAVGAGQNNPSSVTFVSPVIITPGLYGVALVGSGNGGTMDHDYTNGPGGNPLIVSNSFYTIIAGNADNVPFSGGAFFPRVWNGTIKCSGAEGLFPEFVGDVTSGPDPLTVNFTDLTYTSDPGGVLDWNWDFDDDGIVDSLMQNPTWTYASCGRYDVTLTVADMLNGIGSITKRGYITVGDLPVADFQPSVTGGASPLTVTFTDTSTGNPTSWEWDFEGLGVASREQNPTYIFDPLMGTCFDVTLTVRNACGSDTITKRQIICMVVNDECEDAIAIQDGANGPYTTLGATTSSPTWPCALGGSDAWFVYTATCDGNVTIDLCGSDYDTAIEVFDACGGASLGCNDDFCGLQSGLTLPCVTGQVFYVRVGGFNGAQGTAVVNVACQPMQNNDECTGAIVLADGVNGPFDNFSATTSPEPWPCALGGNDAWFQYTATCAGDVTFDLCNGNSTYDTCMEVFDGNGGCGGPSLVCNDDACGLQSEITVTANVGDVFYVRVGGFNGAQGVFELTVTCGTTFADFRAGRVQTSTPGCGKVLQVASGVPTLGSTVTYSLEGTAGASVLWFGLSKLDMPVCGGCSLGTEIGIAPVTSIYIPNDTLFVGATYFTQGMVIGGTEGCDGVSPFGLPVALSDTLVSTVGM